MSPVFKTKATTSTPNNANADQIASANINESDTSKNIPVKAALAAEPMLIKNVEIPIAMAACPGKYFLMTEDIVGPSTAIARPIRNAVISSVEKPGKKPRSAVATPKTDSISIKVNLEPYFLFKTVASDAKIPIHNTGTVVRRLACALDSDSDVRIVSISGPTDVIPRRRLSEMAAMTKSSKKVFLLYILFKFRPPMFCVFHIFILMIALELIYIKY